MRKLWWVLIVLCIIFLLVLFFGSMSDNVPPPEEFECEDGECARGYFMGFSHIFQGSEIQWDVAASNSEYVMIVAHINWSRYLDEWEQDSLFDYYKYLADAARENGLGVYISVDPTPGRIQIDQKIPNSWGEKNFANENVRAAFKNYVERIVTEINPEYLTLGMEINSYYLHQEDDFANFVSLYDETYNLIKAIDNDVKISPTFQYEQLTGHDPADPGEDQYEILDNFLDNSDYLGITSYPRIYYNDFTSVPEDYYSSIRQYSSKPIVFGESGWPSDYDGSSEVEQATYLSFLLDESDDLGVELVIWWFLYDADYPGDFFDTMGLLNLDGSEKLAWDVWLEYYNRPTPS